MPRGVDSAVLAGFDADIVRDVFLVFLDLPGGAVRAHTRIGPIVFGGETFTGVGELGAISVINEESDLSAPGVTVELSGIDPSLMTIVLDEHYQGRAMTVWRGAVLDDGSVSEFLPSWTFTIDAVEITLGATGAIRISGESTDAILGRPNLRRSTDEDQQARYPGDKFYEFTPLAADIEIVWPSVGGAASSPVTQTNPRGSASFDDTGSNWSGDGGGDSEGSGGGPAGDGAEG